MSVMFITTFLTGIAMVVCFDVNPLLTGLFLLFFGGRPGLRRLRQYVPPMPRAPGVQAAPQLVRAR